MWPSTGTSAVWHSNNGIGVLWLVPCRRRDALVAATPSSLTRKISIYVHGTGAGRPLAYKWPLRNRARRLSRQSLSIYGWIRCLSAISRAARSCIKRMPVPANLAWAACITLAWQAMTVEASYDVRRFASFLYYTWCAFSITSPSRPHSSLSISVSLMWQFSSSVSCTQDTRILNPRV